MLGKQLRKLRLEHNMTQKELSEKIHVTPKMISFYELGQRSPGDDIKMELSNIFNVSLDYLMGKTDQRKDPKKTTRRINIYGSVPAGIPIEALQNIEDWEDISFEDDIFTPDKKYIGLCVKGDSMYPKYLEGDTIIVEINPQPENNSDCIVYVNGYEATLKKVQFNDNNSITLIPYNTSYPPKTYTKNDDPITILGKVVQVRRNVN